MRMLIVLLLAWFPATHADYPRLRAMKNQSPAATQLWLEAQYELGLVVRGVA